MKRKTDVIPTYRTKIGKRSKWICGGTFRKNLGYKALIAGFSGLSVLFALIAAGSIAVYQLLKQAKNYAKANPLHLSAFLGLVSALNYVANYFTSEDADA